MQRTDEPRHHQATTLGDRPSLFDGPGEMRALCRALDWSRTPLGPVSSWTVSLRSTVSAVLSSRHPMFLFCGPELVQIYNDGYRPSFGTGGRHPRALGMRGREFWTEIWDIIGPQIEAVMTRGEASWNVDHLVAIERNDRIEEVYWTYSYSPVRDDDGSIAGTLVVCQETTARVLAERRLRTLDALGMIAPRGTVADLVSEYTQVLSRDDLDVPFSLCYLAPAGASATMELVGKTGRLGEVGAERWPVDDVIGSGRATVVDLGGWPAMRGCGPWPEPPATALVVPMAERDHLDVRGAMVLGISARLPFDSAYETFLHAVARRLTWHIVTLQGQQTPQALERARLYEAEHAARAEAERGRAELEAVLSVVPIGIGIASDRECRNIRVNPAFAAQLGIDARENASKSRSDAEALPFVVRRDGVEIPADQLPMQLAAREGATIRDVEMEVVHADGRVVRLLEYAAPLFDAEGDVRGAVGAFVDVTERAELLAREREARADAEAANRAKSEFLATMSHELRTPLNAISGYVELLELGIHGPITAAQRHALERIQSSQRHLLGLINGLLNYARVEAGAVQYELETISLAEALIECEGLTAPQIAARGLIYRRAPDDGAIMVKADWEKLQQILLNLLSNAIKFTDRGGSVDVRMRVDGGVAEVDVADSGRGIPPSRLEHIFEPFVQVDARLTRTQEGVGLGLAISRDLARGMGGDLRVRSEMGAGSTFTLSLPLAG